MNQGWAAILLSLGWVAISAGTAQPVMAQFPPLEPLPDSPDSPSNSPSESSPSDVSEPESQPEVLESEPLDLETAPPQSAPTSPPLAPLPPPLPTTVPPRPFPPSASTIFENVTLSPAFSPAPATVRGISGGALAANELVGRAETITGACVGFIDQQPDHRMVLTQFFNYLSLQIQSTENTTLVVRGPGGTWCNDDYSGKNPGIAGQWLSGTYEIWIGSFEQNTYHPYVIEMTEQQ